MSELKAVIQAGGQGTRLAPYSTVLPKALMPVGEDTVIDHMLRLLAKAGVKTVYITVSKFAPLIRSYCGDGSRWGLQIEYIVESAPLGTIGPLDPIRESFDGSFFVTNSDIYVDLDFVEMLRFHRQRATALTVAVTEQTVRIDYGVLDQTDGRVTGFREKPVEQFCVSTGIYCMEPSIFEFIPRNKPFGFDQLVGSMLGQGATVAAYRYQGSWIDIGRIEDLRRAQDRAANQLQGMNNDGA
jgi:NDP-sugar pyrophosphorylase family protein